MGNIRKRGCHVMTSAALTNTGDLRRDRLILGIQIGSQLVPRDFAVGRRLHSEDALRRKLVQTLPLLDGLVTDAKELRQDMPTAGSFDGSLDGSERFLIGRLNYCIHGGNLQPIVAIRQQLIRGREVRRLQPMVVLTKEEARAGFSKRLNEALDEYEEVPKDRGRRTWIHKRYSVSIETARKWLVGLDIPDEANLIRVATDLKFSSEWLRTGMGVRRMVHGDTTLEQMHVVWERMTTDERRELLEFAQFKRLGKEDAAPQPLGAHPPSLGRPRPRQPS